MPVVDTSSPLWSAVTASHRVRIRVEVWDATSSLTTLYPVDGSVTIDATRAVRRNLSLTVADTDGTLTPTSRDSLLAPFNGNEIKVWRGVTYLDGTYDEAPLGVFRITDVQVSRNENGISLSISGEDRAWWMSRLLYTTATVIEPTNVATVITNVINDRMGSTVPVSAASTDWVSPRMQPGVDGWTDPWGFCRDLANTAGMEAYFDANGIATVAGIPNIDGPAIATFSEDANTGVMLDLSRSMSIDTTPNGYRVVAESSIIKTPWRSIAWDDDALSPTYRDPNVPEQPSLPTDVVVEQSTPLIAPLSDGSPNTEQTQTMAQAMLQTVIGQPITLTAVPNPALDVRDRISVVSTRLGVSTTAMIDSITIPLSADGSMTITARARRLTT